MIENLCDHIKRTEEIVCARTGPSLLIRNGWVRPHHKKRVLLFKCVSCAELAALRSDFMVELGSYVPGLALQYTATVLLRERATIACLAKFVCGALVCIGRAPMLVVSSEAEFASYPL